MSIFSKDTFKSPVEKIVLSVVSTISSGKSLNAKSIASNVAQSLFNSGSSFDNISSAASIKTDNIVSRGSAEYKTSKDISKSASVKNTRNAVSDKEYFSSVNPDSKIAQRTKDADIMIIAVI